MQFLRYLESSADMNKYHSKEKSDKKKIRVAMVTLDKNNGYNYGNKYKQTKKTIELLLKFKELGIIKSIKPNIDPNKKRFTQRDNIIEIYTIKNPR